MAATGGDAGGGEPGGQAPPRPLDLGAARRDIASLLRDSSRDDGSWAPVFIRLAWHLSGTYDAGRGTGGSNGCTMRFAAERADPENAGLQAARDRLEPVWLRYRGLPLSKGDVYVLAGYVAIQETGGPAIAFRSGRRDFTMEEAVEAHGASGCPFGDGAHNPHGSRLPAADLGPDPDAPADAPMHIKEKPTIDAVRGVFQRLGFTDKETVCLIILGHQYGRCHPDVSGFENPWYAFDPTHWNVYLHGLGYLSVCTMGAGQGRFREVVTSAGKRQYQSEFGMGEPFMMLISDMALLWDSEYRKHVMWYDRHRMDFRVDAAEVWRKLTELGCPDDQLVEELHPPVDHPF